MNTENLMTPLEREAAAARLLERAAAGETVELTVLSGLERCVLGGPAQALFEQRVMNAWNEFGEKNRTKAMDLALDALRERGLLLDDQPEGSDARAWSLSPELGLVQAARERPSFVVATDVVNKQTRCLQFLAVGDLEQPVRGVVIEEPVALPSSKPYENTKKMGPLGWMTRYLLVSEAAAVRILTEVAMVPRQDQAGSYPYDIRRFKHQDGKPVTEAGVSVISAGATAHVRLFRQDPEIPDEVTVLTAEELGTLLARVFATGSW
ncbi:hypothetical protein [Catenulispora subtropica]|uniref:Uncharacterized protein n=1 Tax=Catenulispora subtropica TaxID=450798 RepID=A0ABN2RZ70_9ACTN